MKNAENNYGKTIPSVAQGKKKELAKKISDGQKKFKDNLDYNPRHQ